MTNKTIVLRPYQTNILSLIRTTWEAERRVIAVLPTGGGKTEIARVLASQFLNALCISHTRVLRDQLESRLGCPAITVQALSRRLQAGEGWPTDDGECPPLLIWDEIHHADSPAWQRVFDHVPDDVHMVGLTATPWRFQHGASASTKKKDAEHGKGLGDLFGSMIVGVTPKQLVNDGYLVPLRVVNIVDFLDKQAIAKGQTGPSYDPETEEHTGRITSSSATRIDAADTYVQHGLGRKAFIFAHLQESAKGICERLNTAGVRAAVVGSHLSPEENRRSLDAIKAGKLDVLCGCMQLTEGVDVPDVEVIVIDRGCNNLNTYVQICGRAARPAPGKTEGLILDLTGCSAEHGHPQRDLEYWVCTAESRDKEQATCEECGTRVSPMFPTRCMRCDPFVPSTGVPIAYAQIGVRIYAAIQRLDPQQVIDVLCRFETICPEEIEIRDDEIRRAKLELARREEAERRAQAAANAGLDLHLRAQLRAEMDRYRANGWSLSSCARKFRTRVPGGLDIPSDSYAIPPVLTRELSTYPDDYLYYELSYMLAQPNMGQKHGEAWCRRAIRKLFGRT